jgi:hypothetical protein
MRRELPRRDTTKQHTAFDLFFFPDTRFPLDPFEVEREPQTESSKRARAKRRESF